MKRLLIILSLTIISLTAFAKPPHITAEQFFDGRYNKEKTVRTSLSKENGIYYRGLQVTDNPAIVRKIAEAIEKDIPQASKYSEQTGEGGKSMWIKISNNGEIINVGLQQDPSGKNAYLFIKGPLNAFK